MKRRQENDKIIHSMVEFEKNYFPKSFERKMAKKPSDAHSLGIILAKESLNKIKRLLS